ncbi:glycosyltransferase, partial [Escherichia coli]
SGMKLGGFVIHGNNVETLGACLDSLRSVSDEVVAVDSCSTDGSARLDEERGVRRIELPWQGYGAARAAAAEALRGCDYLFFLDADERLAEGSV